MSLTDGSSKTLTRLVPLPPDRRSGTASLRFEEEIFGKAIAMPEAERRVWISEACGEDGEMRSRVEALVLAHDAGDFMLEPVARDQVLGGDGGESAGDCIGHYVLIEQLGTGGFGTVWLADQRMPIQRQVALKILKLGMDTREVVARFQQERQTLALMDHPHIARIFDAGSTPSGRPFIAMELVRGVKLTRFCDEQNLTTESRLRLFLQVCEAVQHAHQKGIIHRDLKPSNVLVTEDEKGARVKVIDFGVAKALQTGGGDETLLTLAGQMVGTPLYMSPEQTGLVNSDVDTRSDIYSLGVMLYELLTGSTPIAGNEMTEVGHEEVRRRIREVDPPRPSQRVRALTSAARTATAERRKVEPTRLPSLLSGDLDWIVMRCLEKDRRRRYESADALAQDLQRNLDDKPVRARPPSSWYVMGKTLRRHRTAFAAAAAILAVLVTGIVASTALAIRSNRAEKAQARLREEADVHRHTAQLMAYEADMSAASLLYAKGDTAQVRQLLDHHSPTPDLPDFRGFEWRYLFDQVRGDQTALLEGHRNSISTVAFSHDGRWLASGDVGGLVHVWDVAAQKRIATPLNVSARIVGVSFSHDGRFLAAGDQTHLHIWALPDFTLHKRMPMVGVRPVYSPTHPVLALGVDDNRWFGNTGETSLWDWETDPDATKLRRLPASGTRIVFSADGNTLATGVSTNQVHVWNAHTGEPIRQFPQLTAMTLALARDGSWLSGTKRIQKEDLAMWSLTTGRPLTTLPGDHTGVFSLAASPVENVLATGSASQRITLWDMGTRVEKQSFIGHQNEVQALAFSPDGQWLASGSKDETVRLWKVNGQRPLSEISGMFVTEQMSGAQISPDGQLIAARTTDQVLRLYRSASLEEERVIAYDRWPLRFSPDGTKLVTLMPQGLLELWDVGTGENRGGVQLSEKPDWEPTVALSPDGGTVAICRGMGQFYFDTRSGRKLFSHKTHRQPIVASIFSPDGRIHATLSEDYRIVLRSMPSGERLRTFSRSKYAPRGMAFSHDSRLLATCGHDNLIKIWDVATGELVTEIRGHKRPVNLLAFTPDGRTLMSAGDEDELFLWHTSDWRFLGRHPIPAPVRSMMLSPEGSMLALISVPGVLHVLRAPHIEPSAIPTVTERSWLLDSLPPFSWARPAAMPPRAPETQPNCIDLTAHYNARLDESWISPAPETTRSLVELGDGVKKHGGILWDTRGIMQVYSRGQGFAGEYRAFPERVTDIPVKQKATKLHFLGAATWGVNWAKKPEIGQIIIHYSDGEKAVHRFVLGVDILGVYDQSPPMAPGDFPGLRIAWTGKNEESAARGVGLRLFDLVWQNPRPEVLIESLDFIATGGCPFLTAITVEP